MGTRAPGVVHMRGVKERLCNGVCSKDKQTFVVVDFHGRIANLGKLLRAGVLDPTGEL